MPSRRSFITPNESKIAANDGSVGGEGEVTAWLRSPAWARKSSWTRLVIGVAARPAMAKLVVSVAWRFAPGIHQHPNHRGGGRREEGWGMSGRSGGGDPLGGTLLSPARAPKWLGLAKAGRDRAVIGGNTAPPGWGVMLCRAMVTYEASPGGGGESWTAGAGVPLVVEEAWRCASACCGHGQGWVVGRA
jgi:hypothetical protein